jgi:hypothetical protein
MLQDFLHVFLTCLAAGVIFGMAVTGVVFLLSSELGLPTNHPP